ncbi:MAG: FAD binding domain-containing protein [Candidatus Binatia bacterium]
MRPRSVDEALGLLQSYRDEAKVLAGGQSLVPLMNFRLAQPHNLIDLNGVAGLDKIAINDQILSLGAMVRQRDVERSPAIAERLPILCEAIAQVAHPAIRNRGTIGGSLVHADPSAELPLLAVALDAAFHLRSARAQRAVAAQDFYHGYLLTDIAPDELLVGIDFRLPPAASGWCCSEIARRHGDFAIVAAAVVLGLDRDRRIAFARVALGGVGPAPLRVEAAEAALLGERPGAELFRRAADIAAQALDPPSDIHAASNYRRHIAGVLVRRGLAVAESRAGKRPGPFDSAQGRPLDSAQGGPLPRAEREGSRAALSKDFSPDADEKTSIAVTVNGVRRTASVEPRRSLVDFLRHDLGLVGTHVGCEHGVCGACTVMLDGRTVRSCLLFAAQADGAEIATIEGVGTDEVLHPLQQAFRQHHAVQCGFCTPGMILAALELLRDHADPTEEEIRAGLGGNLCMCTGYVNIVRAVSAAAQEGKVK